MPVVEPLQVLTGDRYIRAALLLDTQLAAFVGSRVWGDHAVKANPVYPYIVFSKTPGRAKTFTHIPISASDVFTVRIVHKNTIIGDDLSLLEEWVAKMQVALCNSCSQVGNTIPYSGIARTGGVKECTYQSEYRAAYFDQNDKTVKYLELGGRYLVYYN